MSGIRAPQVFIIGFLAVMLTAAFLLQIPLGPVLSDSMVRLVMNGVLVLSLMPMLNAGIGINYGLPVGACAGLLGLCLAVNFRWSGFPGFGGAMLFSLPTAVIFGFGYAKLLDRVKGREEVAATFVGFSFVSVMNFFWAVAPFQNPAMLWPIGGQGMRPSIGLKGSFSSVLNDLWVIHTGTFSIPVGLLLSYALFCALMGWFFETRLGRAIIATGENETFALLSGVDVGQARMVAVILSTLLGAWGMCVYAQSYGFIELYDAPLMMAFPAASAVLVGGSLARRTTVAQVVLGTYLFQTIYVLSGPVANELLVPEVAEVLRMLIANSIILWALLHEGSKTTSEVA
jgi:simple sugar transport system permease protein